jgi:hypothetical protein
LSADRPNRHLTVKEATTMVVVGADVHKRTHTFVAVDEVGRKLGEKTVTAITAGHAEAVMWAREQFGDDVVWAIEDYTGGECDHADGPGSVEVRHECIGRVGPTRAPIAESQAEKASTRQRGYRAYRVLAAQRPRWRSWRFARGCRVWVRIPIPVRNERGREQYWH